MYASKCTNSVNKLIGMLRSAVNLSDWENVSREMYSVFEAPISVLCVDCQTGSCRKLTSYGFRDVSTMCLEDLGNPWNAFPADMLPETYHLARVHDPDQILDDPQSSGRVRIKAEQLR